MPLDPSIILGGKPAQFESPLVMLSQIAQLQQHRAQAEQQQVELRGLRQAEADQAAIRQVLTETGGDIEAALPRLRTIAPKAALEFETEIATRQKTAFDALKTQFDYKAKQLDLGLKVAQGITDEASYRVGRPMLAAMSPDLAKVLPETYDPAIVKQLTDMGLSAKELHDQRTEGLTSFAKGDVRKGLSTLYASARTPQEWQNVTLGARAIGVPQAEIDVFGDYSPENVTRAAQLGISTEKRAELAGQAETRAQTAAHQAETEAVARQQLAVSQGQLAVARQRLAQGGGDSADREALIAAVIEQPGLFDQITPTERGKIAGELQRRGFTGFGKPLSDAAVAKISESKSAIASLTDLREVVKKNEQYIGPIAGLAALNPYSEARQAQADIDRVRQRVGKALEGGVLRKEDEEKYKKILATLRDEPSTALYKIDRLLADVQRDVDTYTHEQRLAGRRVPQSAPSGGDAWTVDAPNGKTYTFKTAAEAAAFKKRAGIP